MNKEIAYRKMNGNPTLSCLSFILPARRKDRERERDMDGKRERKKKVARLYHVSIRIEEKTRKIINLMIQY